MVGLFSAYSLLIYNIGKADQDQTTYSAIMQSEQSSENGLLRPQSEENVQSAKVLASNVKLCANTQYSFEVAYPSDWFTTYNYKEQECLFFAPYSFILPSYPQDYFSPITLKLIPEGEWEGTVNSFKNPNDLFSVISFKNLEINDTPVSYIESVSTGNSLQKGFIRVTYLIYNPQNAIELTYVQQSQEEHLEANKKVLEDMVKSIRHF